MKRLPLFILSLLFLTNCSEEFSLISDEIELADNWSELMIVYGNINPQDKYHYIRVNRGFSGENFYASETELDSVQYGLGELDVIFHVIKGNDTLKSYTCRDTIIEKETGDNFNTERVILQYFKESQLFSGTNTNVKFGVDVIHGNKKAHAITSVVTDFTFYYPPPSLSFPGVEFEGPEYKTEINLPRNGQAIDIFCFVKYREYIQRVDSVEIVPHEFSFRVGRKILSNPTQEYDRQAIIGQCGGFYSALEAHVLEYGDTVNAIRRRFNGVYFKAIAGNSDLALALITGGGNTGFHSNNIVVGNITNGLGLFSSLNTVTTRTYNVTSDTMDKILELYRTKYLFSR